MSLSLKALSQFLYGFWGFLEGKSDKIQTILPFGSFFQENSSGMPAQFDSILFSHYTIQSKASNCLSESLFL